MSDIIVRPARPEEYDLIGRLTVDVYTTLPGGRMSEEYAEVLRQTAPRAAAADVVVAVDGTDQPLGSVTFTIAPSAYASCARPGEAEFRMLVVTPAAQRRGVGETLVRWCIDQARERSADRLVLSTMAWMREAHRLYEKLGFVRTPDRDWSPRPGVTCLTYALEL